MKFNLKQIEAFVWVADLGSFRKAAARLNTTQPNISARIAALETVFDVSLMERDAGSVRLTAQGQNLLEYARAVIQAGESLALAANEKSVDGVLRLGVTEMIVHSWLREYLRVLRETYPSITVELTVNLSVNIEKELFDRSIDLALQSGPFARETSASVPLGVYPMVWVASPELGLHKKSRVTIEDLSGTPVLTHARGSRPYEEIAAHFNARHSHRVRLAPSSNLAACIHMAVDGYGVAAVPESMVHRELTANELVRINYEWVPEDLAFFARYESGKVSRVVAQAAKIAQRVAKHKIIK